MSNEKVENISTGYRPRKLQAVLHAVLNLVRFAVLVCHRRFGKTVFTLNEIIDQALRNPLRNPQYAYVAPTYRQAKKIAWQYLLDYTRNIPGVTVNKTELSVTIERPYRICPKTGKKDPDIIKIMLIGANDPDDLRGIYLDGVVVDEYAQCDPIIWGQIIRPALADRKKAARELGILLEPWAIFIGTPKGQNHFFKRYKKAKEYMDFAKSFETLHDAKQEAEEWAETEAKYGIGEDLPENELKEILKSWTPSLRQAYEEWRKYKSAKNWYTVIYKASETGVVDQDELDEMKEDLTDEEYEQEMECSFTAAILGSYFGKSLNLAKGEGRIGKFPYDPRYPVDTHWDIGVGDKCPIWFSQKCFGVVRYIHYEEYNGKGIDFYKRIIDALAKPAGTVTDVGELGEEVRIVGRGFRYGRHVWPHDGRVQEFGTGQTRQETARQLGLIVEIQPKQRVEDRIQAGRNRLKTCCFDEEYCERGLDCLYDYQKEWDDKLMMFKDKPKHNWASHGSDAFMYSALDDRPSTFSDRPQEAKQQRADSEYDELAH